MSEGVNCFNWSFCGRLGVPLSPRIQHRGFYNSSDSKLTLVAYQEDGEYTTLRDIGEAIQGKLTSLTNHLAAGPSWWPSPLDLLSQWMPTRPIKCKSITGRIMLMLQYKSKIFFKIQKSLHVYNKI